MKLCLSVIADPLGGIKVEMLDASGSGYNEQPMKRCPDCFSLFTTEFNLFNHRVSECKPSRAISLIKINRSQLSHRTVVTTAKHSIEMPSTIDGDIYVRPNVPARARVYRCQGCNKRFPRRFSITRHKQSCKQYEKWAEKLSPSELANIERVIKPKTVPITHPCKKCGMIFSRPFNLRRHQRGNYCRKRQLFGAFTCNFCNKTLKSDDKLQAHKLLRHKNEREDSDALNVSADMVEVEMNDDTQLECDNEQSINQTTPHTCKSCNRFFMTLDGLRNHKLRFCGREKRLVCKGCGTILKTGFSLKRHQAKSCIALKIVTKGSVCCVCYEQFERFELLQEHLEQFHSERQLD